MKKQIFSVLLLIALSVAPVKAMTETQIITNAKDTLLNISSLTPAELQRLANSLRPIAEQNLLGLTEQKVQAQGLMNVISHKLGDSILPYQELLPFTPLPDSADDIMDANRMLELFVDETPVETVGRPTFDQVCHDRANFIFPVQSTPTKFPTWKTWVSNYCESAKSTVGLWVDKARSTTYDAVGTPEARAETLSTVSSWVAKAKNTAYNAVTTPEARTETLKTATEFADKVTDAVKAKPASTLVGGYLGYQLGSIGMAKDQKAGYVRGAFRGTTAVAGAYLGNTYAHEEHVRDALHVAGAAYVGYKTLQSAKKAIFGYGYKAQQEEKGKKSIFIMSILDDPTYLQISQTHSCYTIADIIKRGDEIQFCGKVEGQKEIVDLPENDSRILALNSLTEAERDMVLRVLEARFLYSNSEIINNHIRNQNAYESVYGGDKTRAEKALKEACETNSFPPTFEEEALEQLHKVRVRQTQLKDKPEKAAAARPKFTFQTFIPGSGHAPFTITQAHADFFNAHIFTKNLAARVRVAVTGFVHDGPESYFTSRDAVEALLKSKQFGYEKDGHALAEDSAEITALNNLPVPLKEATLRFLIARMVLKELQSKNAAEANAYKTGLYKTLREELKGIIATRATLDTK